MTSFAYSTFGFIAAIAILVAVHEYGHFQVARRLGVKVQKFSIGFGRALFTWRRKNDPTEYCIGVIPLGGYVKMLDEREGKVAAEEQHQAFNRQSLRTRSAIVFAGPAYNFLFAIFAMWLVFIAGSDDLAPLIGEVAEDSIAHQAGFRPGDRITEIDGRTTNTWGQHQFYLMHQAMKGNRVSVQVTDPSGTPHTRHLNLATLQQSAIGSQAITSAIGLFPPPPPAQVHQLVANAPAANAGLRRGDQILAINGEPVANWNEMAQTISRLPNQRITLQIQRGVTQFQTHLTTTATEINGTTYGRIGLHRPPQPTIRLRYGILSAIPAAIDYNWRTTIITLRSLGRMASARMSTENLSGPITIARLAGHTAQSSFSDFAKFLAILSISLGLINLLPIPLLDGGHLLYFAVEAIRGRPPSEAAMLRGQQIGILLLALLMTLAFYNDIMRLF